MKRILLALVLLVAAWPAYAVTCTTDGAAEATRQHVRHEPEPAIINRLVVVPVKGEECLFIVGIRAERFDGPGDGFFRVRWWQGQWHVQRMSNRVDF